MSAIVGIYRSDGGPVMPSDLTHINQSLDHRGPDGSNIWWHGSVGLGHQRLCTTPESLSEIFPLSDRRGLVITADARLDNRRELKHELGISDELAEVGDGDLILEAYARWGEASVEKLLGDFAFAIWDENRQRLFCARDHFGVKPFYYHFTGERTFVFASEIKAIFALDSIPRELNRERIADFLGDVFSDGEGTFYRNVFRLPAAHFLTVDVTGIRLARYWALDPSRETRLANNDEYAEAFREIFREAVRCRLRAHGAAGSMLSGGLDSSSITAVAAQLNQAAGNGPLKTFSAIFETVAECDEREFINDVLAGKNVEPHFIEGNDHGPFGNLERIQWHLDQPAYGPNCDMVWSIYQAAQASDTSVLFDGHDGDTTVSYGDRYLHELARNGKWVALTSELRGLAYHDELSAFRSLRDFVWRYRVKPLVEQHRSLRFAREHWPRRNGTKSTRPSLINNDLSAEVGMAERRRAWRQTTSQTAVTEREAHFRSLAHPMQSYALELHNGMAAAFGFEKRYPFWDKRLVEFCLSLPSSQKLNGGWTRVVMRRAMEGILPPSVQWRRDKTNFVPSLAYGVRNFERNRVEDLVGRDARLIDDYVNVAELRSSLNTFLNSATGNSTDLFNVWKSASLASWLRGQRPSSRESSKAQDLERGWWSCKPKLGIQMGSAHFGETV